MNREQGKWILEARALAKSLGIRLQDDPNVPSFIRGMQEQLDKADTPEGRRMRAAYAEGDGERAYQALQKDLDGARRQDAAGGAAPVPAASGGNAGGPTDAEIRNDPSLGGAPKKGDVCQYGPPADGAPVPPTAPVPPKGKAPIPTGKPPRPEVGTWDPTEIKDLGEPTRVPGPVGVTMTPVIPLDADTEIALVSIGSKFKHSFVVNRAFKYYTLTTVDLAVELTVSGGKMKSGPGLQIPSVESKGGKVKPGVGYKFNLETELPRLLGKDIEIKFKGGTDTFVNTGGTKTELSVALAIAYGRVSGEAKLSLVQIDSGASNPNDMIKILSLKPSFAIKDSVKHKTEDGSDIVVEIKGQVGLTFEMNKAEVAMFVASKLGPSAAKAALERFAVANTAVAAEGIQTGAAAISAGEMVLVAGFAAGAVITIAALVKGLEEASDIKDTAKQAVKASQDFQAGFCSAYGVAVPGDGDLFKAGRALGLKKMAAELDAYAEYKKMKEGIDLDEAQRKEVVAIWRAAAAKKSGKFRKMVQGQFDAAIKAQFIAAWVKKNAGTNHGERHEEEVRLAAGLNPTGPLPLQPDWSYDAGPYVE